MRPTRFALCVSTALLAAGCLDRGGLDPLDGGLPALTDGGGDARHDAGGTGTRGRVIIGTGGSGGSFTASGGAPGTGGTGTGGYISTGGTGTGGYFVGTGGSGTGGRVASTGGEPPAASGGAGGFTKGTGGAGTGGAGGFMTGTGGACGGVCDLFCGFGNVIVNGCPICKCNPQPACSPADCGPAPGIPSMICADGTIAGPSCVREPSGNGVADGPCIWDITTCPSNCGTFGDQMTCLGTMGCTWLQPGCGEPTLAAAGCYPQSSLNCTSDSQCGQGHQCLKRVISPCSTSGTGPGSTCAACGETITICQ